MKELQTFNLRNQNSNWFLGTVQLFSRTGQDETAIRLQRYIERRHKKLVLACPVIQRQTTPDALSSQEILYNSNGEVMHLRFCCTGALYAGEKRHAQAVMESLGITYQHAVPQSMGDQWQFWNCENVPDALPEYIDEIKVDPMDMIGYGLSADQAKRIVARANELSSNS